MKDLIAILHPYLLLATSFLTLLLVFLALFSKSGDRTKYLFSYFTLGISGYMALYGFMSLTHDDTVAMKFSEIGQLFINQISPALYCFSVFSLNLKSQRIPAFLSPVVGVLVVFWLRTVDIRRIDHYWWGNFNYYGGPDMPIKLGTYFIFFFAFMILSFINFINAYRKETSEPRRIQLKYLIMALGIANLASWDHLPIIGIGAYPFGYIPLTIFCAMVFYLITKHQFLDIRIAIKRFSLALLIYLFLFAISLPAAVPLLHAILKNSSYNPTYVVLGVGMVIGVIFSFGPFIYANFVRNSYWLRGHVTTGLTHELKSPLTAIQGAIDIMSEEAQNTTLDKTRTTDYIEMIKKNASRLETYVQDLLNMAKIQEENISLEKTSFNLSSLAIDVCDSYKPMADKKIMILVTNIEPGVQMEGDPSKIRQVFSNILSNAVKFSGQGEIKVTLHKDGKEILCQITDTGPGVEKKNLKKIFDRFYQVHPNAKGSGIGLTIAKAWVVAHGGHIWAESEGEGKGMKVSFTFPMDLP